jgi:hypothetical protein
VTDKPLCGMIHGSLATVGEAMIFYYGRLSLESDSQSNLLRFSRSGMAVRRQHVAEGT